MTDQHPHTNRLAKEQSPYLLQHAHNPVSLLQGSCGCIAFPAHNIICYSQLLQRCAVPGPVLA